MKTPDSHVPRRPFAGLLLLQLITALAGISLPTVAPAQNQLTLVDITNTVWRFNDSGNDLGTAWRGVTYPNEFTTNWSSGTGLFGVDSAYSALYPAPIHTPMVLGAGRITYYFRTRFLLPQDPASNIVEVTLWADDGAVVYVNGSEVGRVRLPNNPVLYNTRAQLANPEGLPLVFTNDPSKLVLGTNVLAVEVHQQNPDSADVVFGLHMVATGTQPPAILDSNEPTNRTVREGQPTTFTVVGSGIPTPDYRWYHNGALIPGANSSTHTIDRVGLDDAGNYFAVISNYLGTATSRTAELTVLADTNPPYILYALARVQDLGSYLLPFSEVLDEASGSPTDEFNWVIHPAEGSLTVEEEMQLAIIDVALENGTNLIITTVGARDPMRSYVISNTAPIPALVGPTLPTGTLTPVAAFLVDVMPSTNSWRYEHSGTDLGTNWVNAAFSDATWSNGPAPLDVFRAEATNAEPHCRIPPEPGIPPELPATGEPIGTCLLTLSNATGTAQYSTAYFRTRFNFSGDAAHSVLSLTATVDDAAVFYLNGIELTRFGFLDGPVTYSRLADRTVGLAVPETRELAPRGLVQGENVLAVEVHQDTLSSADLTLGVSLRAFVPSVVQGPQLSTALANGNITISWTPPVGQLQSATDITGPWDNVTPSDPPNAHTEPATGARKFYRVAVP